MIEIIQCVQLLVLLQTMAANGGWPRKHRRIPAFGDWNYSYYPRDDDDGVAGVDDWPAASVTPCFDFAPAATMRTAARPADQHKFNKVKYNRTTTGKDATDFRKYFSSIFFPLLRLSIHVNSCAKEKIKFGLFSSDFF